MLEYYSKKTKLPAAAIAGVVVAALILLLCIFGVLLLYRRSRELHIFRVCKSLGLLPSFVYAYYVQYRLHPGAQLKLKITQAGGARTQCRRPA